MTETTAADGRNQRADRNRERGRRGPARPVPRGRRTARAPSRSPSGPASRPARCSATSTTSTPWSAPPSPASRPPGPALRPRRLARPAARRAGRAVRRRPRPAARGHGRGGSGGPLDGGAASRDPGRAARIRAPCAASSTGLFAPELDALAPGERSAAVAAADVVTSWEAFDLMRNDQGLTRDQAVGAVAGPPPAGGGCSARGPGPDAGVGPARGGHRRRPTTPGAWWAGPSCCTCGSPASSTATVEGDRRTVTPGHRAHARRDDPHQRPAPAAVPVPHREGGLHRAPRHRRRRRPRRRRRASSPTAPTPTPPPWPSSSAGPRARRWPSCAASSRRPGPAHRRPAPRPAITEGRPDGPQDPVRHHRPAALRHARLQRRHAGPHPGRRPAGRPRASATSGPSPSRWCACRRARPSSPASTRAPTACG